MHVFTYTVYSYTHSCTGLCANLTSPTNGTVVVTTYAVGSNATYRCNHGFELSELQNRTCLANGTWSGLEPICNCMFKQDCIYVLIHCVIYNTDTVACPYPVPPSNGSVQLFVNPWFDQGSARAIYSCNSGYRLSGDTRRFRVLVCQPSGNWSGTLPTCIRE